MLATGKCPKCETVARSVTVEHLEIGDKAVGPLHYVVSIVCTQCQTILGISIDPAHLKEQVVSDLLRLGAKRG
jgi:hypothetical protein